MSFDELAARLSGTPQVKMEPFDVSSPVSPGTGYFDIDTLRVGQILGHAALTAGLHAGISQLLLRNDISHAAALIPGPVPLPPMVPAPTVHDEDPLPPMVNMWAAPPLMVAIAPPLIVPMIRAFDEVGLKPSLRRFVVSFLADGTAAALTSLITHKDRNGDYAHTLEWLLLEPVISSMANISINIILWYLFGQNLPVDHMNIMFLTQMGSAVAASSVAPLFR